MAKCIWPAWLKGDDAIRTVRLPVGAKVLSAHERNGVCLSVLGDMLNRLERRRFLVAVFGQEVPDGAVFIGTVTGDVATPLHVFELTEGA